MPLNLDTGSSKKSLNLDTNFKKSGLNLDTNFEKGKLDLNTEDSNPVKVPMPTGKPSDETFLERVGSAVDYVGNISRSGIKGLTEGKALQFAKEAAKEKRHTSAEELRNLLGWKNVGKDDGEIDAGDFVDVAGDFAVDMVTDPLNWLTLGVGRAIKSASTLSKATKRANLAKEVGTPALGAVYGAGAADSDATIGERMGSAALGAGIASGGRKLLPKAGKLLTKEDGVFDKLSSQYAKRFKHDEDLPNFFRTVQQEIPKIVEPIQSLITQGKYKITEKLNPLQAHVLKKTLTDIEDYSITSRRDIFEKLKKERKLTNKDKSELHNAFQEATTESNKLAWDRFNNLQGKIEEDIFNATKDWAEDNKRHMKFFNEKMLDDDSISIGLDFHQPKVFEKDDILAKAFETPDILTHKTAWQTSAERRSQPLGHEKLEMKVNDPDAYRYVDIDPELDDIVASHGSKDGYSHLPKDQRKLVDEAFEKQKASIDIYAKKESYKFLDQDKREAVKKMREYLEKEDGHPLGFALSKMDNITSFIKKSLLFGGPTWVKNNFYDNTFKAYVENGIIHGIDSGSASVFRQNLAKDLWNINAGKIDRKYVEPMIQDMMDYNVLSKPQLKALADEVYEDFLFSPEFLQKKANQSEFAKRLDDAQKFYTRALERTTGRVGSYVETMSRAVSYKHNYELLKKNFYKGMVDESIKEGMDPKNAAKWAEDQIKKRAAKIVDDTFFDYGKVTHFENAVLRRVMPFYSFYKNNLPYWVSRTFDPRTAGRVAQVGKIPDKFGDKLRDDEKEGLNEYLIQGGARKIKEDRDGKQIGFMPANSLFDAVQMANPSTMLHQLWEKNHPLAKSVYEVMSGRDTFAENELYPSSSKSGKKYMFSSGHKWKYLQDGLDFVTRTSESLDTYVDKKGNPITTSDFIILMDKLSSPFLPPIINKAAGSAGKISSGKMTPLEAGLDILSPVRSTTISPESFHRQRQYKRGEKTREANLKRKLEQEKLLRKLQSRGRD